MFSEHVYQDQTVFITGGGSGIGLALAHAFGGLGAKVFVASRTEERLAAAVAELKAAGIEAAHHAMDVREPEQVAAAVDACEQALGPVDVLINNAAGNFVCPAEELSPNGWRAVVGIVLDGTFYCSREIGRRMIARGAGGQILNIVATYVWGGGPGVIHSACAKSGVATMTQTLGVEWGRYGIRVNAIAPGPIKTEGATKALWDDSMTQEALVKEIPLARFGELEDVTNLALFLASKHASYISGEVIAADGAECLGKALRGLTQLVLNQPPKG